jgi:hypothetical protein
MKRLKSTKRQKKKGEEKMLQETPSSLGTDPESRLRWLVGFAQETDVPDTAVAIRTLHQQLGAYLSGLRIRCAGTEPGGPHERQVGDPLLPDELPMAGEDNQKPLDEKLALIRTGLRRLVKEVLTPPVVPVRVTGEIAFQRILEKDTVGEPMFREQWVAADVRAGIKFRLLEDLAKAGALLRQCPATGCTKVFVRRYRQEFCTTACRNRTNFRKWYQGTRAEMAAMPVTRPAPGAKKLPLTTPVRLRGKQPRRGKTA